MSYKDFLHAMTPYCYTAFFEDEDEYLKEHRPDILKRVDADGDGTISFTEYFFFLVLLQSEDRDIRKTWKKYEDKSSKTVTRENCIKMLRELRKSTQAGARQMDRVSIDARAIKATEEDFTRTNHHLVELLFKDKDSISYDDILSLQFQFWEDLWHYHFHTLEPNDKGRISTPMLLSSKLCDLPGSSIEKYRQQISKIERELGDNDPGITLQEFIVVQIFFNSMSKVKSKMFQRSFLEYDDFKDIFYEITSEVNYVKKNKVKVPEYVCQSLFGLLDADNSGELEPHEVLEFNRSIMGKPKD